MQSKYKAIYSEYVDKVESGILAPGAYLPSEGKMMEEYNASRDTIRKAMTLLEQNNYILKRRGKESIVVDRGKYDFPLSQITSFSELAKSKNLNFETIVEDLSILVDDESIMEKMNASEEEEIYRVSRVRKIDDERVILDKDYFKRRYVPKLTKEICKNSIYEYIEKDLKLKIGVAKKIVTVKRATREDKMLLDLHDDEYIAVVTSYTNLDNGELFQYTESRHRIDKFQFIEYAKR